MKSSFSHRLTRVLHLTLLLAAMSGIMFSAQSCKSKKKIAQQEAAAAEARRLAKVKADLEEIISPVSKLSLEEKEQKLKLIKDMNIQDAEIQELIRLAEARVLEEREALEARRRAEQLAREREDRLKGGAAEARSLQTYFQDIATASSIDAANQSIAQALRLFASEDVPVLIIISKAGGEPDYDRPTTIRRYLEYLKDQRVNRNDVENVVYDANGKITELELIKK
jgi:hypothetical protein